MHGAFLAGGDELAGDGHCQFADLENAMRCAVIGHVLRKEPRWGLI